MLLGVISPKIRTTIVITAVDTGAPTSCPSIFANRNVPIEATAILTILFPIRIVEIKRA